MDAVAAIGMGMHVSIGCLRWRVHAKYIILHHTSYGRQLSHKVSLLCIWNKSEFSLENETIHIFHRDLFLKISLTVWRTMKQLLLETRPSWMRWRRFTRLFRSPWSSKIGKTKQLSRFHCKTRILWKFLYFLFFMFHYDISLWWWYFV